MTNNGWLAGNWWQLISALVLFGSYVAVLAKAVQTIKSMETRLKDLEDNMEAHKESTLCIVHRISICAFRTLKAAFELFPTS